MVRSLSPARANRFQMPAEHPVPKVLPGFSPCPTVQYVQKLTSAESWDKPDCVPGRLPSPIPRLLSAGKTLQEAEMGQGELWHWPPECHQLAT